MTFSETLQWMFAQLPMYQRVGKIAFKKDLTNTLSFAEHLNQPQLKFKSVHIAGTNGKGSTSHMLASILQEAGYKVGLYTSPHLKDFRERIKINGICVPKRSLTSFIRRNKLFLESQKLSFFEMTVGLAFDYFANQKVDIAVIEVGLGGRLDSTNIITPELSIITNIGYDHMQMLGNTLPEIAKEKAGIIKPKIPVVIGEKQNEVQDIFINKAKEVGTSLHFASDEITTPYPSDLTGNYQQNNIKTVLKSVEILKQIGWNISEKAIQNGLLHTVKNTGLLGRWQILGTQPSIICDTAHNQEGLQYTLKQFDDLPHKRKHFVIGFVNDKDLAAVLNLFPQNAQYYFCQANVPRALDKDLLKEKASTYKLYGNTYQSVKQALRHAKKEATNEDIIYIGGSTFIVAEIV